MADPFTMMLVMTAAEFALSMAMRPKIRGPRLDSLKTTTAEYGTAINRFIGKRKFETVLIHAEDLREVKKKHKGKGGKMVEYKYFGTWISLICDHQIEAVTRIWFDEKLVYDATGAGPISIAAAIAQAFGGHGDGFNLRLGKNLRIYLGDETQGADPRYESWCEDKYGANSAPAYRGNAYVFFEEIPVNNAGNRIPNVSIEAVATKVPAYPVDSVPFTIGLDNAQFSPDGTRMVSFGGTMESWDIPSRTLLSNVDIGTAGGRGAMLPGGSFYTTQGTVPFVNVVLVSTSGAITDVCPSGSPPLGDGWYCGGSVLFNTSSSTTDAYVVGTSVMAVPVGFDVDSYFEDINGDPWAIGRTGSNVEFYNLTTHDAFNVASPGTGRVFGMCNSAGNFFIYQADATTLLVDPSTATLLDTDSISGGTYVGETVMRAVGVGEDSIWFGVNEYSTLDLSLKRTIDPANWGVGGISNAVYSFVLHALIVQPSSGGANLKFLYLDRVGSGDVTLGDWVNQVSGYCGLTGQDTTQLTQPIDGVSATQGQAKDWFAHLLDMHDVDCRSHDFTVQFVNRGSAPSGSIVTADFVRGDADRYRVTEQLDTDLPKELTFNFADVDMDQRVNTVIAQRPLDAMDSSRTESIDLSTYAADPDTAQRLADRYLRRLWNSRERVNLSITAQNLALEPGDVTTISLDGLNRNVRLDKMTVKGSVLDCEFVRDEVSFAALNSAAGAPIQGSDPDTITIPSPTEGFVLDTPYISDSDNDLNPLVYVLAGAYTDGWAGAVAYRGDDGTYDDVVAGVDSTDAATWGFASDALGDANPNLWDRGSSITINIFGTLTSATEAEIDADPSLNLAALGANGRWEFVNFTTATLTGTNGEANVYTVSGFKRGRRGTEGNTGSHAVGDSFVLLDMATSVALGTDDVGDNLSFKVQSFGRDPEIASPIDLAPYTGASLKPYAPARVKWVFDGTDLQGTITRRTRVGGSWTTTSWSVSLGETSEEYEVDVIVASTVVRTITVSGTNTFTYTAAMAAADGVTLPTPPSIEAYQMSSTVGRGFALAA